MELREFIEARLAEDEALARACDPSAWRANGSWTRPAQYGAPAAQGGYVLAAAGEWHVLAKSYDVTPNTYHMARHDPARVLRDVASMRLILAVADEHIEWDWDGRQHQHWLTMTKVLAALAARWPDHPDYNPSWSPEAT